MVSLLWIFAIIYWIAIELNNYGTSDLIETMNKTIQYDIIKPTNKIGEKK